MNAPPGAVAVGGVVPEENILAEVDDFENVVGSAFNDGIFGNNEVNVLEGADGDDVIHGFAGDDFLSGGAGTDTALFSAAPNGVTVDLNQQISEEDFASVVAGDSPAVFAATGGAGNNVLSGFENVAGSQNDDIITGDSNDNVLNGNGGNDTLLGGGGNDTLIGGAGDDFIQGGGGNDITDGGEGIDTVSFADIGVGVDVDLAAESAQYVVGENQIVDSVVNFENVVGTSNDDNIVGDAQDNVLTGGLGNDSIDGGSGIDTADFSDLNVEVTVVLDENGDGTATRINELGETEVDTLTSIEEVIFSEAGGTLNGEPVMQMVEVMDNMESSVFSSLDTQEPASEADSSVFSTLSSENTALPAQVDPSTIFEADSFEADNDLAAEDAGAAADAAAAQSAIDALIAG